MNDFERYIDNYDKSIGDETKNYFNLGKKPDVLSRAFYKLWEILSDFKIPCDTETLHLCEAPGGFIEAMLKYKTRYKQIKKCHTMSLFCVDNDVPQYHDLIKNNTYVDIFGGNGDIYNLNNVIALYKKLKPNGISLITADGGITENGNFNNKESLHTRLILSEMLVSLLILETDGIFVLKIFDIFNKITIDTIYLLSYLIAPMNSHD